MTAEQQYYLTASDVAQLRRLLAKQGNMLSYTGKTRTERAFRTTEESFWATIDDPDGGDDYTDGNGHYSWIAAEFDVNDTFTSAPNNGVGRYSSYPGFAFEASGSKAIPKGSKVYLTPNIRSGNYSFVYTSVGTSFAHLTGDLTAAAGTTPGHANANMAKSSGSDAFAELSPSQSITVYNATDKAFKSGAWIQIVSVDSVWWFDNGKCADIKTT